MALPISILTLAVIGSLALLVVRLGMRRRLTTEQRAQLRAVMRGPRRALLVVGALASLALVTLIDTPRGAVHVLGTYYLLVGLVGAGIHLRIRRLPLPGTYVLLHALSVAWTTLGLAAVLAWISACLRVG